MPQLRPLRIATETENHRAGQAMEQYQYELSELCEILTIHSLLSKIAILNFAQLVATYFQFWIGSSRQIRISLVRL